MQPKTPFKFNSKDLELVDSFQYLGVNFQSNGLLKQAVKLLADKALKAHFTLLSKLQYFKDIPVRILLKLFDTLIMPILAYSSEIWISDFKIDILDNNYQFEKKSPQKL